MAQDFRNTLNRVIGTGDTTILTAGDYDAVIGIRCCNVLTCLLYTSPSPRDRQKSRMPSSA